MTLNRLVLLVLLLGLLPVAGLQAATLDFDSLSDLESVTNQFPGLTFHNTIVLTAGTSLNEFEFPPRSGFNVASDDGGPILITFAAPVLSFGGFFTYLVPLTMFAFDGDSNLVDQVFSAFDSNMALSGDPGSAPNELLRVAFQGGITGVFIVGSPAGGSFTTDDISFEPQGVVPEPASALLLLTAGVYLLRRKRR